MRSAVKRRPQPHDVRIFLLSLLAGQGWLAPGALVILERATRSGPVNWPDGFVPDRARRYGEATFWYGLGPKTPHKEVSP